MKSSILLDAIGEIRDDLILDAEIASKVTPIRRSRRFSGLIAACIAVVVIAAAAIPSTQPSIGIDGDRVGSHSAVFVNSDVSPATFTPRTDETDSLMISLDFRAVFGAEISVSDGTVTADIDGAAVPCGSGTTLKGKTSLIWTIDTPDESSAYTLSIKNAVYTVRFDNEAGRWTIIKN